MVHVGMVGDWTWIRKEKHPRHPGNLTNTRPNSLSDPMFANDSTSEISEEMYFIRESFSGPKFNPIKS